MGRRSPRDQTGGASVLKAPSVIEVRKRQLVIRSQRGNPRRAVRGRRGNASAKSTKGGWRRDAALRCPALYVFCGNASARGGAGGNSAELRRSAQTLRAEAGRTGRNSLHQTESARGRAGARRKICAVPKGGPAAFFGIPFGYGGGGGDSHGQRARRDFRWQRAQPTGVAGAYSLGPKRFGS